MLNGHPKLAKFSYGGDILLGTPDTGILSALGIPWLPSRSLGCPWDPLVALGKIAPNWAILSLK